MATKAKIGVLGASGYTGGELVRMLLRHPRAEIALLTAERSAGKAMREVFPQFSPYELPTLVAIDGLDWGKAALDVAFCALPHATTQKVIKQLLAQSPSTKVVDLSADFRLADTAAYAKWYGHEHHAPELQKEAVYGLCEIHRREIKTGAARRQSRLLHLLRRAAADPADQGQGDRDRRDRDRRQVRHDRGGADGARGHAVLGSVGGLQRLWRRPPPAHGRARPGVFARRRARGDRHLHPASGADEPGHSLDDLRAGPARADAGRSSCDYF